MPQPALIRLARPASSRRLGPILPHARAPPPVQLHMAEMRVLHRVSSKAFPTKTGIVPLLKMTSDERGNQ